MKKRSQIKVRVINASDLMAMPMCAPAGKASTLNVYVSPSAIKEVNQSQSYFLDTIKRIEGTKDGEALKTVYSFKFGRKDIQDKYIRPLILRALEYGIIIDGTNIKVERTLRTPSNQRAGGAWMSTRPAEYREIFSFGFEKDITTDFKTVISKHEAQLTLSCTNTLPVSMKLKDEDGNDRNIRIAFVDDLYRDVKVAITTVADGENETPYADLNGKRVKLLSSKVDDGGNPDIEFVIENGERTETLCLTDGYCLATPEMFDIIAKDLRVSQKDLAYFGAIQFRMPFCKGMAVKFDIAGYCQAKGITEVVDIYGATVNPSEVDMWIPRSVFKANGNFESAEQYINMLNGSFELDGVSYEYFPNKDYFRVVNVNKAKNEYNEFTYQYLQALTMLGSSDAVSFTDTLFDLASNALTDINACKALMGMVEGENEEAYTDSFVSKVQYLLELKPSTFNTGFVKKRILGMIENQIMQQAKGRVMIKGAYHFIISDPTLLFHNLDNTKEMVLSSDEVAGIIPSGAHYQVGKADGERAVAFRSPLIHASEPVLLTWTTSDEMDKWFGHLKGVTILNGYEPVAMRAGGADYDGDKWFETADKRLINGVELTATGEQLPLIISPMENAKALKLPISKKNIYDSDVRTLDNKTGIYTNMGTYYQNLLLHIKVTLGTYLAKEASASNVQCVAYLENTFKELRGKLDPNNFDRAVARNYVQTQLNKLVADINYKLVVIRFAQASEIDFPKHGVRMPFPMRVATKEQLLWLKRDVLERAHDTYTLQKETFGSDVIVAVRYTPSGKAIKTRLAKFNSPIQEIETAVINRWESIKSNISTAGLEILDELVGEKFVMPPLYMNIKDEVASIRASFCSEVSKLRNKNFVDAEERMEAYKEVYNRYTDLCSKFTDRKALAIVAIYISQFDKNNSSDNFAFVCAFDGIVELLSEQAHVTTRTIKIDAPRYTDRVYVTSDGTYYVEPTTGECIAIDMPIELAVGEYQVIDTINARYLSYTMALTEEQRKAIVKHVQGTQKVGKTHVVRIVKNIQHRMGIVGFKYHNHTAKSVVKLLAENNNYFTCVPHQSYDKATNSMRESVGIKIGSEIVGVAGYVDSLKLNGKDGAVQLNNMYNKLIKATILSDIVVKDKDGSLKPAASIQILAEVESISEFAYDVDGYVSRCNLKAWYFQTKWNTLEDLGWTVADIRLADKAVMNAQIAELHIVKDGKTAIIPVGLVGGDDVMAIGNVVYGGMPVQPSALSAEFVATVFRTVSLAFAKRDYKPNVISQDIVEQLESNQEALKAYHAVKAICKKLDVTEMDFVKENVERFNIKADNLTEQLVQIIRINDVVKAQADKYSVSEEEIRARIAHIAQEKGSITVGRA